VADTESSQADSDPRAAAVSFLTTEHFTLQGARSATIAESTGRATMFLSSVSGGLVALGLMATATHIGAAFYAFALILLPTLAFLGFVTFDRTLQSGIEDHGYARRIARLRGYYFAQAPELTDYLLSVSPEERLAVQGLRGGRWQGFLTVAGMVCVITVVLLGSAVGLLAALVANHSLVAALVAGSATAIAVLVGLMRHQRKAWKRANTALMFVDDTASLRRDASK
jgi:threonine/homoserine/homoserine lactone efflux protein